MHTGQRFQLKQKGIIVQLLYITIYHIILPMSALPAGFTCIHLEQVAPEQCHKGREGKTWISRWIYNLEAQK